MAVLAGLVVTRSSRTISGIALPGSTTAASSTAPVSTTPPSTPTNTLPPVRRVTKLADHPLLVSGATLPDATCNLPALVRNAEGLRPYYEELVRCMDVTWAPVLDAARLPHRMAWVNTQEHPGETGCGDPDKDQVEDFLAMYCSVLHTIYLPADRMLDVDQRRQAAHIAVLAHEYGHHVQDEVGILWASDQEMERAGWTTPQAMEMSRRTELQANCFAGLMIAAAAGHGSTSRSLANEAIAFFRDGSSSQSHGSNANQRIWAKKGFDQRTTAACNTFTAPPREVS